MRKRSMRVGAVGAAAGGLLITALAGVASASTTGADGAAASGAPGASGASESAVSSGPLQQAAADYWTPERMRAAEPVDQGLGSDRAAGGTQDQPTRGEARTVQPTAARADLDPQAFPELGAPWQGEGEVTRSVGRIFFSMGSQDSSCTGTAVTSDNKSTVITAGHCVFYQGAWHDNWVFVPGYDRGQAPNGEWPATELFATPEWEAGEDMNFDIGAAVVGQVGGESLTDAVGAQGVAFNAERGEDMYSFGYPAAPPYDGSRLIYSSGTTFNDEFGDTTTIAIDSNMTPGCSGGPWFADFDEAVGAGTVSSVNSFGYNAQPNVLYGPYFGDEAEALYNSVQSGSGAPAP